ncbi:MAG: hypothetical protein RIT45_2099 [Pseudomonadota bacterium]
MDKNQTFEQFLTTTSVQVPVTAFLLNLAQAALLAFVLGLAYARYGNALSNRERFGRNFLLLTMTTMLIITIVKSSLALSLGLVGALSIVRFRAAIKEPEELGYLFLAIAIGLGFGADQGPVTWVATLVILGARILQQRIGKASDERRNLHLTVSRDGGEGPSLDALLGVLRPRCDRVTLVRFDQGPTLCEAAFAVDFKDAGALQAAVGELRGLGEDVRVNLLDSRGVL